MIHNCCPPEMHFDKTLTLIIRLIHTFCSLEVGITWKFRMDKPHSPVILWSIIWLCEFQSDAWRESIVSLPTTIFLERFQDLQSSFSIRIGRKALSFMLNLSATQTRRWTIRLLKTQNCHVLCPFSMSNQWESWLKYTPNNAPR